MDFNFNNTSNKNNLKNKITKNREIISNLIKELEKLDNIYNNEMNKLRELYIKKKKEILNKLSIEYNNNNKDINLLIENIIM